MAKFIVAFDHEGRQQLVNLDYVSGFTDNGEDKRTTLALVELHDRSITLRIAAPLGAVTDALAAEQIGGRILPAK